MDKVLIMDPTFGKSPLRLTETLPAIFMNEIVSRLDILFGELIENVNPCQFCTTSVTAVLFS